MTSWVVGGLMIDQSINQLIHQSINPSLVAWFDLICDFQKKLSGAASGDPVEAQMAKLIIERNELRAATDHMIVYHLLHVDRTSNNQN